MSIAFLPGVSDDAGWLFLRSRVTRLGLRIHGIEAGQHRAVVHLIDDPGFHPFLLGPLRENVVEEGLRDQHRAIPVGDHDVIREYRNATTADRLVPADESQSRDRWRRRITVAPDRETGAQHA